jgi:hypothetical protein
MFRLDQQAGPPYPTPFLDAQINKLDTYILRGLVREAATTHPDIEHSLNVDAQAPQVKWEMPDETFDTYTHRVNDLLSQIPPSNPAERVCSRLDYIVLLFGEMACRCKFVMCALRTKVNAIDAMCDIFDMVNEFIINRVRYIGGDLRVCMDVLMWHLLAVTKSFTAEERSIARRLDFKNPIARLEWARVQASEANAAGVGMALDILRS